MNSRSLVLGGTALALGLALSVVLAEASLRWLVPPLTWLDPAQDAFWLQRASVQPPSQGPSADTVPDAVLGWRMRPGFRGDGVTHDSAGFRATGAVTAGPARRRILVLGDSFTYGLGVADHETYAARLAARTGAEVINAGVNAYGVDQAFLMWEREGKRLAPQVVVLGYFVDDFHRSGLAVRDRPKPRFEIDPHGGRLVLHTPEQSLAQARRLTSRSTWQLPLALDWVERKLRNRMNLPDEALLLPRERVSEQLLRQFKESVTAVDGRLLVVFIGHAHQQGNADYRWIEASIARSCRDLGLDCLNLAEAMRGPDWARHYGSNAHFSPFGHEVVAAQIARALGLGTAP